DALRHLPAMLEGPQKELGDRVVDLPRGIRPQYLPGAARDRPALGPGLIGENHKEILGLREIDVRRSRLKALQTGTHHLARPIDEACVGHVNLKNVGILEVADRAADALHVYGDAFVAFAPEPRRPGNGGVGPDLGLPFGRDLGEVVRECEGRARAVGAVNHTDAHVREIEARVESPDGRIVPLLHFAQEDIGDERTAQNELPRRNAREVVDDVFARDRRRKLDETMLTQDFGSERLVARAERDRARLDLGYPAAGANRLVIDAHAGLRRISGGPLRDEWKDPGATRAGELRCREDGQAGGAAQREHRDAHAPAFRIGRFHGSCAASAAPAAPVVPAARRPHAQCPPGRLQFCYTRHALAVSLASTYKRAAGALASSVPSRT